MRSARDRERTGRPLRAHWHGRPDRGGPWRLPRPVGHLELRHPRAASGRAGPRRGAAGRGI